MKKIIIFALCIMVTINGLAVRTVADEDGDFCTVGVFAAWEYAGTGSPVKSNINSAKTIQDDIIEALDGVNGWQKGPVYYNKILDHADFVPRSTAKYAMADNCDLLFYVGHGVVPGDKYGAADYSLVLTTNKNSYYVEQGDLKLGERDCEWFITFTCNFLNGSNAQIGRVMNGLHTLCGFSTDMTVTANAGELVTGYLKRGISVKEAYFAYAKKTQAGSNENTACVFTTVSLANDRIWGYGTVGADPLPYSQSKSGYIKYIYQCNW